MALATAWRLHRARDQPCSAPGRAPPGAGGGRWAPACPRWAGPGRRERWGCFQALHTRPPRSICQRVLRCQGGEASPDGDAAH